MAYDRQIAAATVFMEASGEPPEGRRAVAWTLVNRLKGTGYGDTLAAVCLKAYQFSSWDTPDSNRRRLADTPDNDPILRDCEAAVDEAVNGTTTDPTGGATFYFATSMPQPPSWAASMTETATIGGQKFFKAMG
jgi:N-acetylmuramoyl-L-alanine amidase